LADASTFLYLPPVDIPVDAPPDAKAQLRMISSAPEYLKQAISKLPNFFAIPTTVRYGVSGAVERKTGLSSAR
jgi:hypothetical protein